MEFTIVCLFQILNGLKTALQKQYNEFISRHPHFLASGGTVSVIAHSLGSVMLYDILREKCQLDPAISDSIRSSSSRLSSSCSSSAAGGGGRAYSTCSGRGGGRGMGVEFTVGESSVSMDGIDGDGRYSYECPLIRIIEGVDSFYGCPLY